MIEKGFLNVSSSPISVYDAELKEGQVVQTVPAAGNKVSADTTIYIQVNSGKDTNSSEVPNLSTMTVENAKMMLESVGLQLDTNFQYESSDAPKDTVIEQSVPMARWLLRIQKSA